jgi:PKD repeat protein
MFGGFNHTTFGAEGDTWLFANGTWTNLSANLSASPAPRWAALMTWDPWNQEMVLFGGRTASATLGDTWAFGSAGWTQLFPSASPSARQSQFSAFTADPSLRADYLYGGSCYLCGTIDNDSWTFVNGTWTNVTSSVTGGPPILDYGAWDPPTTNIIGYASTATNCSGTSSTFAFNGTAWKLLNATSPPGPVTQGGGLVYDAIDSELILFGGGYDTAGICAFYANTWSYSNGTWTNLTSTLSAAPAARCCFSVAYDQRQGVLVLMGGAETSQAYNGDTWTFPAAPLAVTLNRSSAEGAVSTAVTFSANVTGGVGPLSQNWSFGDGSSNGTDATVNHTYSRAGSYAVNFTVEDAQGRSIRRSFAFQVAGPLTAGVEGTPLRGEAPLLVNFSANLNGGAPPYSYSWAFGDGGTGSGANVSHLYREKGNFSAVVTVHDASGQSSRASVNVSVSSPLSIAVLSSPGNATGDAPFLVNFTAEGSGNDTPFSAVWTFGDGSPSATGLDVSHVYSTAGLYEAEVTLTDAAGHEANGSEVVSVAAPFSVTASAVRISGVAPFSAAFSATVSGGSAPFAYEWSFGDGTANATGATPSHVYTTPGRYEALLTTTDRVGGRTSADVRVDVVAPLGATAEAGESWGVAPLSVAFAVIVTGGLSPEAFAWSFGDGGSSTDANTTHVYTTVGTYSVSLAVSDPLGESVHQNLTVDVFAPLRVSVSASPQSLLLGAATNLTAAATGGSGSSTFSWGSLPAGCGQPIGPMVHCTPTAPGTYNVTVSVVDSHNETAETSVELNVTGEASSNSPLGGSGATASDLELVAAAAAGAVVGAVAVVVLHRRRGSPPPEASATEPVPEDLGVPEAP